MDEHYILEIQIRNPFPEIAMRRHSLRQRGSSLLWAIGALVILSATGAALSRFTAGTTQTLLTENRKARAYYAAHSGLNYARELTTTDLQAVHDGTLSSNYSLGDADFNLSVGTKNADGTFPVAVLGTSDAGKPGVANFYINAVNVTPATSTSDTWTGGDYVVNAGNTVLTLPQAVYIPGDVAGAGVTLSQSVEVTGKVVSSKGVNVGQYGKVGGTLCAQNGDVMLHQYAIATGDVLAYGNITLGQYAEARQNAYATANIYMNQYAKIYLTGQAGGTISRAQYDSIGTPIQGVPPTVTCADSTAPTAPPIICPAKKNVPATSAAHPLKPGDYKALTTNQYGDVYLQSTKDNTPFTFSNINFSQYTSLYLDISSGGQMTILVCGTVSTGQYTKVYIKTATSGGYKRVSEITPHSDATLIYIGSDSTLTFNQYSEWFGTAYSKTQLNVGQYFTLVGTLASKGGMNLSNELTVLEFVLADYAKEHWTK
jgi:predicted acyltransferase (DUF342 family)